MRLIEAFAASEQHEPTEASREPLRLLIGLFDEQSSQQIKHAIQDLEQVDLDQWA